MIIGNHNLRGKTKMLFAIGLSTSIVGLYAGAFLFGASLAAGPTKERRMFYWSAMASWAVPLGWLGYGYFIR